MSEESLVGDKVNGFDFFFHFPKFQLYMYMYRYLILSIAYLGKHIDLL